MQSFQVQLNATLVRKKLLQFDIKKYLHNLKDLLLVVQITFVKSSEKLLKTNSKCLKSYVLLNILTVHTPHFRAAV